MQMESSLERLLEKMAFDLGLAEGEGLQDTQKRMVPRQRGQTQAKAGSGSTCHWYSQSVIRMKRCVGHGSGRHVAFQAVSALPGTKPGLAFLTCNPPYFSMP